jgi:hypothetical protein
LLDSRIERANVSSNVASDGTITYQTNIAPYIGTGSDIERDTFINSAGVQFDNTTVTQTNSSLFILDLLSLKFEEFDAAVVQS